MGPRIASGRLDRPKQMRHCVARAILLHEQRAQIEERTGVQIGALRLPCNRSLVRGHRIVRPPESCIRKPEVVLRLHVARLEREASLKRLHGLVEAVLECTAFRPKVIKPRLGVRGSSQRPIASGADRRRIKIADERLIQRGDLQVEGAEIPVARPFGVRRERRLRGLSRRLGVPAAAQGSVHPPGSFGTGHTQSRRSPSGECGSVTR